jgi:hypothetical protein
MFFISVDPVLIAMPVCYKADVCICISERYVFLWCGPLVKYVVCDVALSNMKLDTPAPEDWREARVVFWFLGHVVLERL